jgi:hypothetical protein
LYDFKKKNITEKMFQTERNYFIVLALIILFSSFLPNDLLFLLDSILIRITIVIVLLFLISVGPTAGIMGLIAVSILYLERNRRKVSFALQKLDAMDIHGSKLATVEEASRPQQTVPVQDFDVPNHDESDYFPVDNCDSGQFEPVAPTINEKAVLATIYPLHKDGPEQGTGSNQLFEELGFGHLPGVQTIGDSQ